MWRPILRRFGHVHNNGLAAEASYTQNADLQLPSGLAGRSTFSC